MIEKRWLRIIPVALIMYTISYVDRTNIALALDPKLSSMMKDLVMNDTMAGRLGGIFFLGYLLLQIPGGYLASRWSARKVISVLLVFWGLCAVGCGLSSSYRQFEVWRFLLGMAESGVFPATLVLLANWFPSSERARANAYWYLCQPLAVAGLAPFTASLLSSFGWQNMLIIEGVLPFIWLPIWWFGVRDHPRQAAWISTEERNYIESTLRNEAADLESQGISSIGQHFRQRTVYVMLLLYFLHNCAAYGCMTFLPRSLDARDFSSLTRGILFAIPYAVTAVVMVITSWSSDKMRERRGHVAAVYFLSGTSLILSVALREHFWVSYGFLCLAIPGPFAAMGPFWTIASETMPKSVLGIIVGMVNAFGNLGGFVGQAFAGWLNDLYKSTAISFNVLGVCMLGCAGLAFLLPKAKLRPAVPKSGPPPVAELA